MFQKFCLCKKNDKYEEWSPVDGTPLDWSWTSLSLEMFFGHVHGKILPLILQHPWAWVSFHHVQRTDPDSKSLSLLLPYFTLRPFCACQDSFAYLQLACLSLVLPHGPRPNDLKGLTDHNLALNMSKAVRQMKFWRCPLASSRFHKKTRSFFCTQTLYY